MSTPAPALHALATLPPRLPRGNFPPDRGRASQPLRCGRRSLHNRLLSALRESGRLHHALGGSPDALGLHPEEARAQATLNPNRRISGRRRTAERLLADNVTSAERSALSQQQCSVAAPELVEHPILARWCFREALQGAPVPWCLVRS